MSTTRKCVKCEHLKPMSEFNLYTGGPRKGTYAHGCKSCNTKQLINRDKRLKNAAPKHPHTPAISEKPEINLNEKIDLSQLLDLNGWTEEEIKELLLTVIKYRMAPYHMRPREIYKKFFASRSSVDCGKVVLEFTEAAEHGLSIDVYLKGGRKFRRDGKKVVALAKK